MSTVSTYPRDSRTLARRVADVVTRLVPPGRVLPDRIWQSRHRAVVWVLCAHVPGILVFALLVGEPPERAVFEILPIVAAGTFATLAGLGRTIRSVAASTTRRAVRIPSSGPWFTEVSSSACLRC